VSVLVLNHDGREHLEACLPTLEAQTYPRDRLRIEVVDNGSTDGSADWVQAHHPRVVLHRFERNLGFAEPYDTVARKCESEHLVFLNNDTRVDPNWVGELVAAADEHGADCVASRIIDWDGQRIDFIGGVVSFIGHTWQRCAGEPVGSTPPDTPLLFACGGSMLIKRDVYVDAGGFDRDFFIYFEDVDLGWRLALLGYKTVLAAKAVTYHRLHGLMGKIAVAQRLRLYERNALAMIYKNYADETLRRVLPAAIAMSLARGLEHSGLDRRMFAFGARVPPEVHLSARTSVHLLALEDFCRQLPVLSRKRAEIQARRRVPDSEVLTRFGDPFRLHDGGRYGAMSRALIRDFEIEAAFNTIMDSADVRPSTPTPSPPSHVEAAAFSPPISFESTSSSTVSVIIVTALGPTHLGDCLASLRAQTYPEELREVIVVDNGSAEDPGPLLQREYPGARLVRRTGNDGFAVANNAGARAATGEYLAFLNDDTRAHPAWLEELIGTARRRRAASVASQLLNWNGQAIDFAGGTVNFQGRGFPLGIGEAVRSSNTDERPLLFACGGAMLVDRRRFLETDGWDEGTFAYYEDVELGWRLWLLGHEVWFSPRSIVYHKHHGTAGRWPEPPRVRLYERNSLRIIYTLLERQTLERVLPAALLLSIDRALLATELGRASRDAEEQGRDRSSGLDHGSRGLRSIVATAKGALREHGASRQHSLSENLRRIGLGGLIRSASQTVRPGTAPVAQSRRAAYQIERGAAPIALDGRSELIPSTSAAAFVGVYDFLQDLPELSTRRARFQAMRRRSDREILSPFDIHWTSPPPAPHQALYEDVHYSLVQAFDIAEVVRGATARAASGAASP
jgi:GT2 family glycosyltransferase